MSDKRELSKKTQYDLQYAKEKIKRIPLDMQLKDYEALQAAANTAGEKVNTYIKRAIQQRMEREKNNFEPSPTLPDDYRRLNVDRELDEVARALDNKVKQMR